MKKYLFLLLLGIMAGCASHPEVGTAAKVEIVLQDSLIYPGSRFEVKADKPISIVRFCCLLHSRDSVLLIGESDAQVWMLGNFSLCDTLNYWRDHRQYIQGEVELVYTGDDGRHRLSVPVYCPFVPCRMKYCEMQNYIITDGEIGFRLRAYSNGSERYIVSYRGFSELLPHTDTIAAETLDVSCKGIPATQLYRMEVRGLNAVGAGEPCVMLFGADAEPHYRLQVLCNGRTLVYHVYYGNDELSAQAVQSVEIRTRRGDFTQEIDAVPGDTVDLAFLEPGVYLLCVTLTDGQQLCEGFHRLNGTE